MRLVSNFNYLSSTLVTIVVICVLSACSEQRRTTVVNYPINKAFVYNNKIEIAGTGSKDEKKQLTTELDNYWDDSIRIRSIQKFGFFYKIKQPAVFEPINLQRSISFMNAYLQTRGFYRASFKDSVSVDTVGDQLQTHIVLNITPGSKTLVAGVFPVSNLVQGIDKVLGHPRFVQRYLPGQNRSMVPVPSDHIPGCLVHLFLKCCTIAVILPSQDGIYSQNAE